MHAPLNDWDLLASAPREDWALRELFTRHRHYVFRTAWGVLNEDQAAEDVVQEVFWKIAAGKLKARPRARFTTWLYRVAINTSREQARGRRRLWGDRSAIDALTQTADYRSDPSRIETINDLGHALATLPMRQREVLVLRFLEGFDTAETAEILGCRAGTVKAHLHRATLSLRETLGNLVE